MSGTSLTQPLEPTTRRPTPGGRHRRTLTKLLIAAAASAVAWVPFLGLVALALR